jgi:hypothetical protein
MIVVINCRKQTASQQNCAAPTERLGGVVPLLQSYRTYGSKKKILTMGETDNQ